MPMPKHHKEAILRWLGLVYSMFLFTTAGYFVFAFVTGRLYEPILWVLAVEEIYFAILSLLGLGGVVLFTWQILRAKEMRRRKQP